MLTLITLSFQTDFIYLFTEIVLFSAVQKQPLFLLVLVNNSVFATDPTSTAAISRWMKWKPAAGLDLASGPAGADPVSVDWTTRGTPATWTLFCSVSVPRFPWWNISWTRTFAQNWQSTSNWFFTHFRPVHMSSCWSGSLCPCRCKCRVAVVFLRLLEKMWLGSSSICAAVEARSVLSSVLPQFNNYSQQDAHELLLHLLNLLHDDFRKVRPLALLQTSYLRRREF